MLKLSRRYLMEQFSKKNAKPIYMWQCVVCDEYLYSQDVVSRHCGKLTQWINGIEGKGIDMDSPKVKINVSGYIEMTKENFDRILTHPDPHMSLIYSIHMGYCHAKELEFTPEE